MNMKTKLAKAASNSPRATAVLFGGVTALTVLVSFGTLSGAFAQAFEVCGSMNVNGAMAQQVRRLMSFLVAVAVGGGVILAAIDHTKTITESSGGEKFWKSSKLYGAVGLAVGLYAVDWAISMILQVNVTCLMPWGPS